MHVSLMFLNPGDVHGADRSKTQNPPNGRSSGGVARDLNKLIELQLSKVRLHCENYPDNVQQVRTKMIATTRSKRITPWCYKADFKYFSFTQSIFMCTTKSHSASFVIHS